MSSFGDDAEPGKCRCRRVRGSLSFLPPEIIARISMRAVQTASGREPGCATVQDACGVTPSTDVTE